MIQSHRATFFDQIQRMLSLVHIIHVLLILLLILTITACRYWLVWLLIHIFWFLSLDINRLVKVLSSWSHVGVEAVVEHVVAVGLFFFLFVVFILILFELVHRVVLVIHFWSMVMLLVFVLRAVVGVKRVALDASAVGERSVGADGLALQHQRAISPWRCMFSNSIVEISYLLLQVRQLLF